RSRAKAVEADIFNTDEEGSRQADLLISLDDHVQEGLVEPEQGNGKLGRRSNRSTHKVNSHRCRLR
ncbi:hypothetical protein PFISCL1PPCAC_3395, partial [Pristionchus fissidentatus]